MIIRPAPYSKNSILAIPEDNKNGLKGREANLIDALNGRYSHRCGGYILPESKEKFLRFLVDNNWDANWRILHNSPAIVESPDGRKMTVKAAKKEIFG